MHSIELSRLAWAVVPALMVVLIQWRWSLEPGTSLLALARMVIQLCLIGYVLNYIFAGEQYSIVLLVLTVMLFASSWIALRSVPERRKDLFLLALVSTVVVNAAMLTFITQLILEARPWYNPSVIIPIAGMIFASGMNSISLFAERYFSELRNDTEEGLARGVAYQATLIPIINSLFAVGLVSLPGMMTGQILSGVSPMIAVRYQIMVMLMLFASSGLTAALFYQLLKRKEVRESVG